MVNRYERLWLSSSQILAYQWGRFTGESREPTATLSDYGSNSYSTKRATAAEIAAYRCLSLKV